MRKILSLILIFALILTVVGCADNASYDSDEDEKTESKNYDEGYDEKYEEDYDEESSSSPKTIMDAFDGEKRLWFKIDNYEVSHDAEVWAVYVIENKTVMEAYYKYPKTYYQEYEEPIYGETFTLADFDGLSDDEILKMVRKEYADAERKYTINYDDHSVEYEAAALPYEITYDGRLDSSGNSIEDQWVYLTDHDTSEGIWHKFVYQYCELNLSPKTVKNKEYVGFGAKGTYGKLITLNTFSDFDPELDDPDGAVELY